MSRHNTFKNTPISAFFFFPFSFCWKRLMLSIILLGGGRELVLPLWIITFVKIGKSTHVINCCFFKTTWMTKKFEYVLKKEITLCTQNNGSIIYKFCRDISEVQGPGAEKFFETPAPAPLLFNKLWLQLQIGPGNFNFHFEILICNICYK